MILCVYIVIIPTDAVCCPDINIENVVLSKYMIGDIAENTALRNVLQFRIQRFQSLGFRV